MISSTGACRLMLRNLWRHFEGIRRDSVKETEKISSKKSGNIPSKECKKTPSKGPEKTPLMGSEVTLLTFL